MTAKVKVMVIPGTFCTPRWLERSLVKFLTLLGHLVRGFKGLMGWIMCFVKLPYLCRFVLASVPFYCTWTIFLLSTYFFRIHHFRLIRPKSPYIFFKRYRCHHKTRHNSSRNDPTRRTKNTKCPFSMIVRINKEMVEQPCSITLDWNHNHPLNSLEVNTFKDILPETATKVKDYFDRGFSPGKVSCIIYTYIIYTHQCVCACVRVCVCVCVCARTRACV